jgi:hypothetical protein
LTSSVDIFMSSCLTLMTPIMIGSWLLSMLCIFLWILGSPLGLSMYFVTSSPLLSYMSLINFLSAACTPVFSTAPFCLYVHMFYVSSSTPYSLLQTSVLGTMKPMYAWYVSHMLFSQCWLRAAWALSMVGQAHPLYVSVSIWCALERTALHTL